MGCFGGLTRVLHRLVGCGSRRRYGCFARPLKTGLEIDPNRMDEFNDRFACIYGSRGDKIELWQPLPAKP